MTLPANLYRILYAHLLTRWRRRHQPTPLLDGLPDGDRDAILGLIPDVTT